MNVNKRLVTPVNRYSRMMDAVLVQVVLVIEFRRERIPHNIPPDQTKIIRNLLTKKELNASEPKLAKIIAVNLLFLQK